MPGKPTPKTIVCLLLAAALWAQTPAPVPAMDGPAIELGKPMDRELKGGETHSFRLSLRKGHFVKVVAYQKGVDLVLTALDPNRKQLQEVDSPNGTLGPELLAFTAEAAGEYRFEVKSLDPKARVGRYTMSLEILLSPEENQRHSIAKIDPALRDKYAGTYQLSPGHMVTLSHEDYSGSGGQLVLYDHKTRAVETLLPHSNTEFFSGPKPTLEYPARKEYGFQLDAGKNVCGVSIGRPGGKARFAKRVTPHTQETVTFQNKDVTLRGKPMLPAGKGPFPSVVLAHGSGGATRNMGFFDAYFVHLGMAVLSFDKRGAGQSTGNWRTSSFDDLAADVLAGVAYLKARSDIDPTRIGIHGGSQGGWIGSLAAARSKDVSFLIVVCGSGVSVVDNVVRECEGNLRQTTLTEVDVQKALAFAREIGTMASRGEPFERMDAMFQKVKQEPWSEFVFPGGSPGESPWWLWYKLNGQVDSVASLRLVKCPVLWLLADRDWNIPTPTSERRIKEALQQAGNPSFLVKTFTPATHMMWEARTVLASERESWTYFVPGYWDLMGKWLRGKAIHREAGSQPNSSRATKGTFTAVVK